MRRGLLPFALWIVAALAACDPAPNECDVCHRPMHSETFYEVHLEDGTSRELCCPRCGLRFQAGRDDVVGAEVADFYTRDVVDAKSAIFVEDSSHHACSHSVVQEDRSGTQYEVAWDRCLPSVIGFSSAESARRFQAEYGGTIKTYDELLKEIS